MDGRMDECCCMAGDDAGVEVSSLTLKHVIFKSACKVVYFGEEFAAIRPRSGWSWLSTPLQTSRKIAALSW